MDTSSVITGERRIRRRGRPAATITLQSPVLVPMAQEQFDEAVQVCASVLRSDWALEPDPVEANLAPN